MFYISLTSTGIKRFFETKFLDLIEVFKNQYDYILINGSPVLKLDNIFLEVSDKVVIPTFLDNVTTKGMVNLIEEVGVNTSPFKIDLYKTHIELFEGKEALEKFKDRYSIK